jgi:hypothetical protein
MHVVIAEALDFAAACTEAWREGKAAPVFSNVEE